MKHIQRKYVQRIGKTPHKRRLKLSSSLSPHNQYSSLI
jgi:hypothetical protein